MTVILCGVPPKHPSSGDKPVFGTCLRCQKDHYACPECGSPCEEGYGLAGGGVGRYWACDVCDYFYKEQEPAEP